MLTFRLFDPIAKKPIGEDHATEKDARAEAADLITSGEYEEITLQHLEDGLHGRMFYCVADLKLSDYEQEDEVA